MHDIKAIRSEPERFITGWTRRGMTNAKEFVEELILADEGRRLAIVAKENAERTRKLLSAQIGKAKKQGEHSEEIENWLQEVAKAKEAVEAQTKRQADYDALIKQRLEMLPNLPAADVPDGPDETANVEVRKHGEKPRMNFEPKDHVALGEALGGMDFETAAKLSGARFTLLSGEIARMERALAMFMLDVHTREFGYTEIAPPLLVRDETMYGTGQLPKFEEDLFRTARPSDQRVERLLDEVLAADEAASSFGPQVFRDLRVLREKVSEPYWLIPTAEVPLTNIVADSIVADGTLPRRYTAWTPCFRSEAGSAGKDTRGMIRVHQFQKVELVSIARPEESDAEHERMTACAEEILKRLGLAYRVMLLSAGDMGFGARKTYDLEVWLPSQNTYREISSCSNCGDFQARRMNARFKPEGSKETVFLHTLNGSGVAVGRALVAVLENYQQADGSVVIPEVLRPYMGGLERIEGRA